MTATTKARLLRVAGWATFAVSVGAQAWLLLVYGVPWYVVVLTLSVVGTHGFVRGYFTGCRKGLVESNRIWKTTMWAHISDTVDAAPREDHERDRVN